jgi:hypothetical protein
MGLKIRSRGVVVGEGGARLKVAMRFQKNHSLGDALT